jgi:hypothetical protein
MFLPNLNEVHNLEEGVLGLVRDPRARVIARGPSLMTAARNLAVWSPEATRPCRSAFDDDHGTTAFLFAISRTCRQTMIERNIRVAFHEAGLQFDAVRRSIRRTIIDTNSSIPGESTPGLLLGEIVV